MPSPISTNTDAFTWIGSTGGSWGSASNWNDTTAKKNPATTVPGAKNAVTIAGSTGLTYEVITGGGSAASVGLTNQVDFSGAYTFGGLTIGLETSPQSSSASFTSGDLALGSGLTLKLGTFDVLDGQVTVGAGAVVTASGAVSLGQPSESGVPIMGMPSWWSNASSGSLTVNGGGSFTAAGNVSVLDGSLDVDGTGSKASVGGNLTLGALAVAATTTSKFSSSASSGTVSLTNGGNLAVTGSVTDYDGGSFYLYDKASFTANGTLTFDVGSGLGMYDIGVYDNSTMRVANLTVADPTASGQSLSIDVYPGTGQTASFEVGTKGGAAAGSITVDAAASITSTAGLSLSAGSIVDNGKISETGGTLDLEGATSGSGSIALGANSILDIGASGTYNSTTDSDVYTPYALATAISGFSTGDGFIFDDVALTKATYTSTGATTGKLQLYVGSTLEETLQLTGKSYTGDTFFISPTTNDGSEVTLLLPAITPHA